MQPVIKNKENALFRTRFMKRQNKKKLSRINRDSNRHNEEISYSEVGYKNDNNNMDLSTAYQQQPKRMLQNQHLGSDDDLIEKAPLLIGAHAQRRMPRPGTRDPHDCFMSGFYHQVAPPRTPTRTPSLNHNRSSTVVSPPLPIRVTQLPYKIPSRNISVPPIVPPPRVQYRMPMMVGDARLRIYRLRLPSHLMRLLDTIVLSCEAHAATQSNGWLTDLYSLTKQDIALQEVPMALVAAKPIALYIQKCMKYFWGVSSLHMDRNQPHVLRYDRDHVGVELHHDKCDITSNLCLSRNTSYVGGGTFFPDARQVVRLEFGEFLLHPGSLVHSGRPIKNGTRHLMVIFAHIER